MPLVSVIVPYYNGSKYIQQALDSIYCQTYKNIEIIVVDDASTNPDDVRFIENISKQKGFTLIKHQENKGIAKTMADAFNASKGDYIAELSQDDFYKPEKIKTQLDELIKNNWDAVYAASDILKEDTGKISQRDVLKTKQVIDSGRALEHLYLKNLECISIQGLLAKREVFQNDIIPIWNDFLLDDWPVNIRLFEKYKVGFIETISWTGRGHSENTSKDIWRWFGPQIEVAARMTPHHVKLEAIGGRFISLARRVYNNHKSSDQSVRLAFAGLIMADSNAQQKRAYNILSKISLKEKKTISNIIFDITGFFDDNQEKVIKSANDIINQSVSHTTWDTLGKDIFISVLNDLESKRLSSMSKFLYNLSLNILKNDTNSTDAIKVLFASSVLSADMAACDDIKVIAKYLMIKNNKFSNEILKKLKKQCRINLFGFLRF